MVDDIANFDSQVDLQFECAHSLLTPNAIKSNQSLQNGLSYAYTRRFERIRYSHHIPTTPTIRPRPHNASRSNRIPRTSPLPPTDLYNLRNVTISRSSERDADKKHRQSNLSLCWNRPLSTIPDIKSETRPPWRRR